jgi:very-short-patch-repair endonuclease
MNKCKHCDEHIDKSKMANHVKWKHPVEKLEKHKFILFCSCLLCQKTISSQNLKAHILAHESKLTIKNNCKMCHSPIYNNINKFCDRSCAASYNNRVTIQSEESKIKRSNTLMGNTNHRDKHGLPKHLRIVVCTCIICSNTFTQPANKTKTTCSDVCRKENHSKIMKEKIKNGYNPNKHRGRHKRSYMETSFEEWLTITFHDIKYETEHPFKSTTLNKTFFTDFFFTDLQLAIELDGTQHKKTVEYDAIRDANILYEHGVYVYRISHKEYTSGIKINEVSTILSM